jgi:hypothetical protein
MEKKTVLKEDGRYLVYYHFPDSATLEQAETFAAVPASAPAEAPDAPPPAAPLLEDEDRSRV